MKLSSPSSLNKKNSFISHYYIDWLFLIVLQENSKQNTSYCLNLATMAKLIFGFFGWIKFLNIFKRINTTDADNSFCYKTRETAMKWMGKILNQAHTYLLFMIFFNAWLYYWSSDINLRIFSYHVSYLTKPSSKKCVKSIPVLYQVSIPCFNELNTILDMDKRFWRETYHLISSELQYLQFHF